MALIKEYDLASLEISVCEYDDETIAYYAKLTSRIFEDKSFHHWTSSFH